MSNDSSAIPKTSTQSPNSQTQARIYARVSAREQKRDGVSFEDQEREARRFCSELGLDVIAVYSETGSARNEDVRSRRPVFNKVIELSIQDGARVVVTKCDRFSRSFPSYDRFETAGGKLIPVELQQLNPDPAEIRALIKRAEDESDRGSRLAREGIARKRAAGETFGNPKLNEARPLAAVANKVKGEARLEAFASEVAKAHAAGCKSPRDIVEYLNTQSPLMTPRGVLWGEENVRRLLKKLRAQTRHGRSPLTSAMMTAEPTSVLAINEGLVLPIAVHLPKMAAHDDAVRADPASDNQAPVDQVREEVVIIGDFRYVARMRIVEEAPGIFTSIEVENAPADDESNGHPVPHRPDFVEFVEPAYEWPEYADAILEIEDAEPHE